MAKSSVIRPSSGPSVDEAFGSIMRDNFNALPAWEKLAYEGKDIEGVHQVRVILRRMRSALSVFRKVIPREITDPWGEEMRWAANAVGPARDLDVFIDEGLGEMRGKIPLPAGEEKLAVLAGQKRDEAYLEVRTMLESDRYRNFKDGFAQWVQANGWYQEDLEASVRQRMRRGVTEFAIQTLTKRASTLLMAGEHIASMTAEELHQLRIECKKLRYATEFFTPLFDKESMAVFSAHFKGVQGILGTLNDVAVGAALVDRLVDGHSDIDVQRYAGAVVGWRSRQYEEVKGRLYEYWGNMANTPFPWLRVDKKRR